MELPTNSSPSSSPGRELRWRVLQAAEKLQLDRQTVNRLKYYCPYPKQLEFHAAGVKHRERLFMAGNQLGKTMAGAAETAMHLTGRYPNWWTGRRFAGRVRALAGSESAELTRKGVQTLLIGEPSDPSQWGTGLVPKEALVDCSRRPGVPDALSGIVVKHVSGGNSVLQFQSYDQGRSKWQADTLDFVWFDEEPPEDVYSEGLTRTNATDGMTFMTFTPLKGMSSVVRRFLLEQSPHRAIIKMVIDDALHITPAQREQIIAQYPSHERKARTRGEPTLGEGQIYPIDPEEIAIDAFELPRHFPRLAAMDFGYNHPFAAVEIVWDRDRDIIYVTKCYKIRQATPIVHAAALRPWGAALPWAWPHDGLQHSKDSGQVLADQYRAQGLNMLSARAQFDDGSIAVEAGIMDILDRMQTGRWKVFRHLNDWFEEFRLYHRKDGRIVKEMDDLMDASRYALMMKRYATTPAPIGFNRHIRYRSYGIV
jgi:phage terminase large subunit-like protein